MSNVVKRATNNVFAGVVCRIVTLAVPFIARTLLLRIMSYEYLGLSSLFTAVLNVLNLAELGVDVAITYNMYKPISEGDDIAICALLGLYKRIYQIIGLLVLGAGMLLVPFIDNLIYGSVPSNTNIYILFVIYLVNSSLSYLLYAHKRSLLVAQQRNNVISIISAFTIVFQNVTQIALYYVTKNYYVYIIVIPVSTIVTNLVINYISNKYYPQYQPRGQVNKNQISEIKKQIGGLLVAKICLQSRNAFDSIVASALMGLTMVTIYQNYFYVIQAIHGIMGAAVASITSTIGILVATGSREKNHSIFDSLHFLYLWISIWVMALLYNLFQDFMIVWAGKDYIVSKSTVGLFSVYGFLLATGDIMGAFSDANGIWWEKKKYFVIESVINIVLNIFLGLIFGIDGIIAASIIAVVYSNYYYGPKVLYEQYFRNGSWGRYVLDLILYFVCFIVICYGSDFLINNYINAEGLLFDIYKIIITTILSIVIFVLVESRNPRLKEAIQLVKKCMFYLSAKGDLDE